jgi:hypothetical protein
MADKSELPNIKVLRSFRGPEGIHVPVGAVFPKSALEKGDWSTLVNMTPPRAEETDDRITDGETAPKRSKKAEEALLPTA